LVTYVTPDWFLHVGGFPSIGPSAILHLETTGLIEHWSFGFALHRWYWYVL